VMSRKPANPLKSLRDIVGADTTAFFLVKVAGAVGTAGPGTGGAGA
jgi:hypothetical protein